VGECPAATSDCQPMENLRILIDVRVVIVIDEVVPNRLSEYDQCDRNETANDNYYRS
jgi:hypothetical protein